MVTTLIVAKNKQSPGLLYGSLLYSVPNRRSGCGDGVQIRSCGEAEFPHTEYFYKEW